MRLFQQALANPATTVTAVWDETPERGRAQAHALGVPFYENLPELLTQAQVDGVMVTTPTTMHREVIVAAAQAGKHIFTEKVLAPTLRECNEIVAAVEQAGVVLMVSLPRLSSGSTLAIKHILDRKLLGDLTEVRTRLAHDGALRTQQHPQGWLPPSFFDPQQAAGGAMIDLGAHPMYLARLFLGLPQSVSATYASLTGRAPWRITRWWCCALHKGQWVSSKPALSTPSRRSPSRSMGPKGACSMGRRTGSCAYAAQLRALRELPSGVSGRTSLLICRLPSRNGSHTSSRERALVSISGPPSTSPGSSRRRTVLPK